MIFRNWVLQNFPFLEDDFDALTDYELFCKMLEYVKEFAKDNEQFKKQLKDLEDYIYNLNLQDEVDKKLDEMAEDGTLENLIGQYLELATTYVYNSVSEMKSATNLINGCFARTSGFYSFNDGGGAYYKVRTVTNDDVIDDILIISLHDNTLVAELITEENKLYAKQLGCHLDKSTDDTVSLQYAIDIAKDRKVDLILNGYAYVSDTIQTKGVHIIGIGMPAKAYQTYEDLGWNYMRNTGDGANVTFSDYVENILTTGSGIISDEASPILENNYEDQEQFYGQLYLENLCICGWLRTLDQVGIATKLNDDTTLTYARGTHHLKDVNVINCGGTGIYLNSLEMVELNNVKSCYNFGYGLHIEGVSGVDTPFEYVTFNNCDFTGDKLGGIYAHNSFKKHITFNNCMFNFTGLYKQLGIDIPTTTSSIVPAIKISGTESTDVANAKENLLIYNCYGEETQVLVNIDQSGLNFNNINIYNNTVLPESLKAYYCILYINANYSDKFNFYSNKFNGANPIIVGSVNQLKPIVVDKNYYDAYTPIAPLTINANLSHMSGSTELVNCQRYGNVVELEANITATASISAYADLITGIPKPLYASYFIGILNDTTPIRLNCYTNKKISTATALSNTDNIKFHLVYLTEYNVDK